MPHVLVAGRIHAAGLDRLRAVPGMTVEMIDEISTESYAPRIPEADALLIRTQPLPGPVVAAAPRLRIVSRHGVGYDAVDVAALDARGIALTVVGDVNSRPVAEHTFALLLGLAKRLTVFDAATRGDGWGTRNGFSATELWDKTLFVIGFGRIGRLVSELGRAFGMRVIAYDPFLTPEAIAAAGVTPVSSVAEGLRQADAVTLHVPKAEGKPLIGAAEVALLRPHAVIVNTARGDLIDEGALADALDSGALGGAGLDVFAREPPRESPLLQSPRTILTPHSAALTQECAIRMSTVAAQNIIDYFAGTLDPRFVVNYPAA